MHGIQDGERQILRRAGEAFAAIRQDRGLSQADLAAAARLHVNTVSYIERGVREPSILALGLLCLELGCDRIEFDAQGFLPVPGPAYAAGRLSAGLCADEGAMAILHGVRIRDRRRSAGFSIDDMARAVSLHPNTLRNFELGIAAPSVLNACRIYRFLGVPYVDGSGFPEN